MVQLTHALRRLLAGTALTGVFILGCDRSSTSTPRSTTTTAADAAPSAESKSAKPQSTPPANTPSVDAGPDISKLPEHTQRLIRDARTALAEAPGSADLPAKLGMIYLTNGMEADSIPLFRQAIERIPNQPSNWYYLGIALSKKNDVPGAIAAFQKVVSLDSKLMFAHLRLGELLLATDKAAALVEFEAVAQLAPTAADTLVKLARGLDQLGKSDEAMIACRKAVEVEPACGVAHATLAELLEKKGDQAGAKEHRALAVANVDCNPPPDMLFVTAKAAGNPSRAGIMRALGLAGVGNFEIAVSSLKRLEGDDPMNLDIPLALGQVYQIQGNLTQAIEEFAQVLRSDPDNFQAAVQASRTYIAVERFSDAERTLRKGLAGHPDSSELLQLLGYVLAKTDRVDDGIKQYRKWIELRKGDPAARIEFAQMLAGVRRFDLAMNEVDPLTKDSPVVVKALLTRSNIKGLQGDARGAEDDLRAALAAEPGNPEPVTALGVLFATNKQYDRAIEVLRKGAESHPRDPAILNALAWLLATAPQASLRDGAKAVELAKKVCDSTHNTAHGYLDTLGAAYAEVGKFDQATSACRQAMELATRSGQTQIAKEYEMRLTRYSINKAYRMPE